jgi:hypothetical protein
MFVCETCHYKPHSHMSGSYGRCEGCGQVAECHNCGCRDPWDHSKDKKKEKINDRKE